MIDKYTAGSPGMSSMGSGLLSASNSPRNQVSSEERLKIIKKRLTDNTNPEDIYSDDSNKSESILETLLKGVKVLLALTAIKGLQDLLVNLKDPNYQYKLLGKSPMKYKVLGILKSTKSDVLMINASYSNDKLTKDVVISIKKEPRLKSIIMKLENIAISKAQENLDGKRMPKDARFFIQIINKTIRIGIVTEFDTLYAGSVEVTRDALATWENLWRRIYNKKNK